MFDVKQLLCHLLGIASKKEYQDSATLLYLFFKPRTTNIVQQKQIDEIFKELTDEIDMIFHSEPIHHFISKHHITLRAVAEYAEIMEPLSQKNLIVLVGD